MDIVLIRHLKPVGLDGICYGKTDVVASDDIALLSIPFELIGSGIMWTSPLSRCLNLATRLQSKYGYELNVDARISELDFGNWEMQAWDAIGPTMLDDWIASGFAALHNGESLMQFDARILSWCKGLDRSANHVVVTHAGVIRSIYRQFLGITLDESLSMPVPFGVGQSVTLI
jgi:alpha-ribazole phosphatase